MVTLQRACQKKLQVTLNFIKLNDILLDINLDVFVYVNIAVGAGLGLLVLLLMCIICYCCKCFQRKIYSKFYNATEFVPVFSIYKKLCFRFNVFHGYT